MNGTQVGHWTRRSGVDQLVYRREWIESPEGRPLSLSLPYPRQTARDVTLRTPAVAAYFENLIPDNERILQRIRDRYRARSANAFDLLAAVGRDCVGALQLVPEDEEPGDSRRIDAQPLDEAGVAQVLRNTTVDRLLTPGDEDAFRLSIAGAQEKTALLRHGDRWCVPHGATPSTHIFKLPLGLVGNMRADLSSSVELEWLCMELVRAYGLPVANVEIGHFEDQKALIVERFDRRLSSDRGWWMRVPQEDMCQAGGLPPSLKYESDGGPGIRDIMEVLRGSNNSVDDRITFFRAQLLFWLMAATDGHAKNFSLTLLPGGAYQLTPLYDILSTYPIQGHGTGRLDPREAKLAMAVTGRNRHYKVREIHRWHWTSMAAQLGLETAPGELVAAMVAATPRVLDQVGEALPEGFPQALYEGVRDGMLAAAKRLEAEPDLRGSADK
ncbi:type II toxin-antitoxin system HipA family toxin [Lysobacter sp. A378]